MAGSSETMDLVKDYSEAHLRKTNLEAKLTAAKKAKKPNEKSINTLRERLADAEVELDTSHKALQDAITKLEITSNASEGVDQPHRRDTAQESARYEQLLSSAVVHVDDENESQQQSPPAVPVRTAPISASYSSPNLDSDHQYSTGGLGRLRVNPPARYNHGDDFNIWCSRFRRYLTLAHIDNEHASMLFLNQMDDRTSKKLDPVARSMTATERADPSLFIPIFERKIYPESETKSLRVEITHLKQEAGETVEDFAIKIQDMAHKIWGSISRDSPGDEMCYSIFLGGLRKSEIRADVMRDEATSFEEAVEAANKAEKIFMSSRNQPSSHTVEPAAILQVDRACESNTSSPSNLHSARERTVTSRDHNSSEGSNAESGRRNMKCHRCQKRGHIARYCYVNLTADQITNLNSQRAGPSPGPNRQ